MTAGESLEALAVRELQIHFPAVGFDQAEAVKLARGAVVNKSAEVAPVHVEAFAGRELDTNVSAAGNGVLPQSTQIILDDGEPAVEAERLEALRNHGRVGVRVLLQQLVNGCFP